MIADLTHQGIFFPSYTYFLHVGVGGMEQLQTRPSVPQHVRYINNNTSNNTTNSSHQQQQQQQQDNNNSNSSSNNPHIITTSRGSGGVGSIHQHQQTTYSVSIAAESYTTSVSGGDNSGNTVADVVLNDRSAEIQQLERRKDEQQQEITRLQNQLNQQSAAAAAAQAQAVSITMNDENTCIHKIECSNLAQNSQSHH